MRALPLDLGILHFVGIGGIGMSGIAEVLHNLGYQVQGSDLNANANVTRLRRLGIEIKVGHAGAHVDNAAVVVISSAVKPDNPEVLAARLQLIPVVRRAEMLAELMRLKWSIAVGGTHGKTTTTSLIAALLDHAQLDPTVINGGIINAYGTNARLGGGEWMIVEADESDGTFVKLPATIAVVTNIDPEHLDHYGSVEALHDAFETYVENIPFYGFAVLCTDHPVVQALIGRIEDRRLITYGFNPQAEVRGENLRQNPEGTLFDVVITDRPNGETRVITDCALPMVGQHNVQNALAAIAVGLEMGLDDEVLRQGFAAFGGVKRRFTKVGESNGITVVDDYAHHPVEITAVIKAARQATGNKVIAVVQPHRYTRLLGLFEDFCSCFNEADHVIVAPVFAAGEDPIDGVDRDALVQGLRARGHRAVSPLDDEADLARMVKKLARPGDLVICLGAGSITNWAQALPAQLTASFQAESPRSGAEE
tara:strand:- start:2667 stop:4106 length:1440 start_codon:yes stop_codon:yes gene_type:complete